MHADTLAAILVAWVALGGLRVVTVRVLNTLYNPSAALFERLSRVPVPPPSFEPADEGGYNLPPRCALTGAPRRAGRRATVNSLEMSQSHGFMGLGWVVPASRRGGSDGAGAVTLSIEGEQVTARDDASGEAPPPSATVSRLNRVTSIPWLDSTRNVSEDGVTTDGLNQELRCGSARASLVAAVPGLSAVTSLPGGMFDCHTLPLRVPLYVGLRSEQSPAGGFDRRASLIAFRENPWATAASLWSLPVNPARLPARAPLLVGLRRSYDLDGLQGVELNDGRVVVVFRHRNALHVGVITPDLQRLHGTLQRLRTLGGAVGLPRIATDGRDAMVVFADRHETPRRVVGQPSPEPERYRLWHTLVRDGIAQTPFALATTFGEMEDEFAPAAASLPDGSWVVTWSAGALRPQGGEAVTQRVWMRRYQHGGSHLGGPVLVSRDESASDSRVASTGDRIVVAWAAGTHASRRVMVQAGHCR